MLRNDIFFLFIHKKINIIGKSLKKIINHRRHHRHHHHHHLHRHHQVL